MVDIPVTAPPWPSSLSARWLLTHCLTDLVMAEESKRSSTSATPVEFSTAFVPPLPAPHTRHTGRE